MVIGFEIGLSKKKWVDLRLLYSDWTVSGGRTGGETREELQGDWKGVGEKRDSLCGGNREK